MSDLNEKLELVTNRESFLEFVRALIEDRKDEKAKERVKPSNPYGQGANGWENTTVEDYLEAALAWAEATRGRTQGLSEEVTWKGFALFLYCGKIYE